MRASGRASVEGGSVKLVQVRLTAPVLEPLLTLDKEPDEAIAAKMFGDDTQGENDTL